MSKIIEKDIEAMIYVIRGQKVMLDSDLAALYAVETGALNRAVKRNIERFPEDFCFELNSDELASLRCQFGSANSKRRFRPFVFTENGVAMLSTVLHSAIAIQINIQIMRAFSKLRGFLRTDESLVKRVEKLEEGTSALFKITFDRLDVLEADLPILPSKRKKITLK